MRTSLLLLFAVEFAAGLFFCAVGGGGGCGCASLLSPIVAEWIPLKKRRVGVNVWQCRCVLAATLIVRSMRGDVGSIQRLERVRKVHADAAAVLQHAATKGCRREGNPLSIVGHAVRAEKWHRRGEVGRWMKG